MHPFKGGRRQADSPSFKENHHRNPVNLKSMTNSEKIIEKALADINIAEGHMDNAKLQFRSARKILESIAKPKVSNKKEILTKEELAKLLYKKNIIYV